MTARATPDRSSEVRVFLRSGVPPGAAPAEVQARVPGVTVVRAERGGAVEREADDVLRHHRRAASAGFMFTAALLNAKERGVEMAVLIAMGGTAWDVLAIVCTRAALIGIAGALAGSLFGVAAALSHDLAAATFAVQDPSRSFWVAGLGVAVSLLSAIPAAAHAALRNHVAALQE